MLYSNLFVSKVMQVDHALQVQGGKRIHTHYSAVNCTCRLQTNCDEFDDINVCSALSYYPGKTNHDTAARTVKIRRAFPLEEKRLRRERRGIKLNERARLLGARSEDAPRSADIWMFRWSNGVFG